MQCARHLIPTTRRDRFGQSPRRNRKDSGMRQRRLATGREEEATAWRARIAWPESDACARTGAPEERSPRRFMRDTIATRNIANEGRTRPAKFNSRFFTQRFDDSRLCLMAFRATARTERETSRVQTEITRPTAILSKCSGFTQNASLWRCVLFRLPRHSTFHARVVLASVENGARPTARERSTMLRKFSAASTWFSGKKKKNETTLTVEKFILARKIRMHAASEARKRDVGGEIIQLKCAPNGRKHCSFSDEFNCEDGENRSRESRSLRRTSH